MINRRKRKRSLCDSVRFVVDCVWWGLDLTPNQIRAVVLPKSSSEPEQTRFKLQTRPEVRFRFSNSTEPNRRSGLRFWPLWNCRTMFEYGSNRWNCMLFHILSLGFKSLAGQVCWTCQQIQNKKSFAGQVHWTCEQILNKKSLAGQVHWTCKQIRNKKSLAGRVCWTCKQIWESQLWFDPHTTIQIFPSCSLII